MKFSAAIFFCLLCVCVCPVQSGTPRVPELPWTFDSDPALPLTPQYPYLPPAWKELWLDALEAEDEDLRREAAMAILREYQRGNLAVEDTAPALLQSFRGSDSADARLALAAALIELDARQAADVLAEFASAGSIAAAQLIEPALAQWGFQPVREAWIQRLRSPQQVSRQRLLLAIDGVRRQQVTDVSVDLRALALDRNQAPTIRLAAGEALGELQSESLTGDSARLASDASPGRLIDHLVAAKLLSTHRGPAAEEQLLALAQHEEPAVAAVALRRLVDIHPQAVHPLTAGLLESRDGEVRRLAAQSLAKAPLPDTVQTLAGLLSDPHPAVRRFVREALLDLARSEQRRPQVEQHALKILAGDDWRGLEQSGRLLGELDHKQAAARLVELLPHERPEVYATAAWSLRELAVEQTLPEVHAYLEQATQPSDAGPLPEIPDAPAIPGGELLPGLPPITGEFLSVGTPHPGRDACFSYLFEFVGEARHADATPILRRFIPKSKEPGPHSRAAAVWALGLIHEHGADEELIGQLGGRVADDLMIPMPEFIAVRASAAVALGRIGDEQALPTLQATLEKTAPGSWLHEACRWAIEQITGEPLQPTGTPSRANPPPDPFLKSIPM